MVGYHVTAVSGPPPKRSAVAADEKDDESAPEPRMLRFLSDRHGAVSIPIDPAETLQTLYIRSGKTVLARSIRARTVLDRLETLRQRQKDTALTE